VQVERAVWHDEEGRAMEIILALAVMLAIWVLVIWGSSYFNNNVV
jgi:hypothetical protein